MKRFVAFVLVFILAAGSAVCAEESVKSIFAEAGDFLSQKLDELTEAADDALSKVGEAAGEMWESVSDTAVEVWDWAVVFYDENSEEIRAYALDAWEKVKAAAKEGGADALAYLKEAFISIAVGLDVSEENAEIIWNTVMDYAKKRAIEYVDMAKITIAAIVQIKANMDEGADLAEAIVQYIESSGVSDQASAEAALTEFEEALAGGE